MRLVVIDVPYDCGQYQARTGAGPAFLIARGLPDSLRAKGHDVELASVRTPEGFQTEWSALIALQQQIASLVRTAARNGRRALILSGNCAPAALGAIGGLGGADTAVLWMDAHADFNTPETSPSGFLDGMALSLATGSCWRACAAALDVVPVAEDHVVQIGVRDVDVEERCRLDESRITHPATAGALSSSIDAMSPAPRAWYVHLDLDVVDAGELRANQFACGNGPSSIDIESFIRSAGARLPIHAAAITALNPVLDPERAWPIVERLAHALAE